MGVGVVETMKDKSTERERQKSENASMSSKNEILKFKINMLSSFDTF